MLFAEGDDAVVLLADWEWSTVGSPVTDLAWAELIVRMHHPEHAECLPALFDGYGARPPWSERQAAMTAARWGPDLRAARHLCKGSSTRKESAGDVGPVPR